MEKKYGIRVTLPGGDTMSAPHLLGERWESYRWFASEADRERALADMSRQLPNYRRTDYITQILERVQR